MIFLFIILHAFLSSCENNNNAQEFNTSIVHLWESQPQQVQYLIASNVVKHLPVHHAWNLIEVFDKKHRAYQDQHIFEKHYKIVRYFFYWMYVQEWMQDPKWASCHTAYECFLKKAFARIITLYKKKGYIGIMRAKCVVNNLTYEGKKIFFKNWLPLAEKSLDNRAHYLSYLDCLLAGIMRFRPYKKLMSEIENGSNQDINSEELKQKIQECNRKINQHNEFVINNWPIQDRYLWFPVGNVKLMQALEEMREK